MANDPDDNSRYTSLDLCCRIDNPRSDHRRTALVKLKSQAARAWLVNKVCLPISYLLLFHKFFHRQGAIRRQDPKEIYSGCQR